MVVLAERSRPMQEEFYTPTAQQANGKLYTFLDSDGTLSAPTLITNLFGMNTKKLPLSG